MNRRRFLLALSGLPFVGKFIKPAPALWEGTRIPRSRISEDMLRKAITQSRVDELWLEYFGGNGIFSRRPHDR